MTAQNPSTVRDLTPEQAWQKLIDGEAEHMARSSLDYADASQVARQVLIDGKPWTVLLRASS